MNNNPAKIMYHNTKPYPEIRVEGKNPYYAEILMDDYSGVISEFSTINQYIYHSVDLGNKNEDLSNMWLQISIVEMHHLHILGELISLLGGNPIYRGTYSTLGQFWNGGLVYYGSEVCDRLNKDLESEYQAIEGYKMGIATIEDTYIKEILNRIILDEKVHIGIFKEAIKKYC